MVPALSLVFPFVFLQVVSIGRLLGSQAQVLLGINLVLLRCGLRPHTGKSFTSWSMKSGRNFAR